MIEHPEDLLDLPGSAKEDAFWWILVGPLAFCWAFGLQSVPDHRLFDQIQIPGMENERPDVPEKKEQVEIQ